MSRRTHRPRRLLAAALAVAAGVAVIGCEPARAGAAAIVGDERITVAELARDTQEVMDVVEREGGGAAVDVAEVNRLNLRRAIVSRLLAEAAAREGVEVTDGEVDQAINQVAAQTPGGRRGIEVGLAVGENVPRVPPSELESYVRDFLIQNALGEELVPGSGADVDAQRPVAVAELLQQVVQDLGVTVNPRFGTWNPAAGNIDLPGDMLSKPESGFADAAQ